VARASEASEPVTLGWSAPVGCPDAAYIEREIDRLADTDHHAAEGPLLTARADVRQESFSLWRVDLHTAGPDGPGVRTVTAESCRALADATALILALALESARAAPGPGDSPAAGALPQAGPLPPAPVVAVPAPAPVAEISAPRAPAVQSPVLETVRWAARVMATIDVGTLPAPAPGVAASLALIPRALAPFQFELGAGVFADESTEAAPARSGTFSLRAFDAMGCAVTAAGRIELGACAGLEVAWVSAAGLDETLTYRRDATWLVPRAHAGIAYPLGSAWALRADAGGGFDVRRPEFASAGVGQGLIHRPALVTGLGALGLELRF